MLMILDGIDDVSKAFVNVIKQQEYIFIHVVGKTLTGSAMTSVHFSKE